MSHGLSQVSVADRRDVSSVEENDEVVFVDSDEELVQAGKAEDAGVERLNPRDEFAPVEEKDLYLPTRRSGDSDVEWLPFLGNLHEAHKTKADRSLPTSNFFRFRHFCLVFCRLESVD